MTAFHRALDLADDHDARTKVLRAASAYDGVLDKLAALRREDAAFPDALARHYQARGELATARAAAATARTSYEQKLAAEPANSLVAQVLADLLLNDAEMATGWTILKPTELKSEGGATLTKLEDNSILASGKNPDQDAYQITTKLAPQRIRAIRLEVLPDASLPHNGPGRFPGNGNFHLNEFRVLIHGTPQPLGGIIVSFAEHEGYRPIIDGTIDGIYYWGVAGRAGQQDAAVVATDLELRAEDTLTFELISSRCSHPQANVGRFRLLVTDNPSALDREKVRFAALQLTDPWSKLAAAYRLVGDQPALDKLLKQHPEAQSALRDLPATP